MARRSKGTRKFGDKYYGFDDSFEVWQRALGRAEWLRRNGYLSRITKGKLKYYDHSGRERSFTIYRVWKWKKKRR